LAPQAERTVDQQAQQGRQGHHAEATKLEQHHDHHLAEGRPIGAGVDHHQAGHADRRDSSEQCSNPGYRLALHVSGRQGQESGTTEDGEQEYERDSPTRMQQ